MVKINIKTGVSLKSVFKTVEEESYPITRIKEWSESGEPLEVFIPELENAEIKKAKNIWERFVDFFPFQKIDSSLSLGEAETPLIKAGKSLSEYTGLNNLYLKNETQNPSWSFKDRGSFSCLNFSKALDEKITATISTGNMGNSISAYGARAGIKTLVFLPHFTPQEKVSAIGIHGAKVFKIETEDYSQMKKEILNRAEKLGLRVVSGNGPLRVEGYKSTAFELYEQSQGDLPDYIAVPTSACGHIRGIFKGFKELKKAGLIEKLPKMIIVQSENINPIVAAVKQNKDDIIPAVNKESIAEAITSGSPYGGKEIIAKAKKYGWLAEDLSEEAIVEAQKALAKDGFFVEPASATSLGAVKKLREKGEIEAEAKVCLMLTGSGLKDAEVIKDYNYNIDDVDIKKIDQWLVKDNLA